MEFVNEQYDVRIFRDFVNNGFESLFKVTAVFCPGNYRPKVEGYEPLACKGRRNLSCDDLYCNAFHDGRLSDSRISYQHRVVLASAAENLDDALDLIISSYERVQLAFPGGLGDVVAELLERGDL